MDELTVSADRFGLWEARQLPYTGIWVRAKFGDKWDSVDIAVLDAPSLLAWLRSRGGENQWAENTVGLLLSHDKSISP